jgi:ELWxxDGT repeat protein
MDRKSSISTGAVAAVVACTVFGGGEAGAALTEIEVNAGGSSAPAYLEPMGSYVYFAATGSSGRELYRTDGTTATLVADIHGSGNGNPQYVTAVGSWVFFAADDGSNGVELHRSNGTGSNLVRNINPRTIPAVGGSSPQKLIDVSGTLYFTAYDDTLNHGRELWTSDGTFGGTVMVEDIYFSSGSSYPDSLTVVGSSLFFSALDYVNPSTYHGRELWWSDGTLAGTDIVQDIAAGAASSYPAVLGVVGSYIYFGADNGTHGKELWRSNGTTTERLTDIHASGSSQPEAGAVLGTKVLFRATDGTAGRELWSYDTSGGATTLLKDIWPGSGYGYPTALTTIGSTVWFRANDGTNGYELWKTDGTPGGTVMVKDIHATDHSTPAEFTSLGGMVYFTAKDQLAGRELWVTDGTDAVRVTDINASGDSNPDELTVAPGGTTLLFSATDGTDEELYAFTPAPEFVIGDATVVEGDSGTTSIVFTVALLESTGGSVTVDWATSDGTATTSDFDYDADSGTLTFLSSDFAKTITVTVNGDSVYEPDETIIVTLSNPGALATILDATGTGLILNDDPGFSVDDSTPLSEADAGTHFDMFTVRLQGVHDTTLQVSYATADGTASVADGDYVAASGTLDFAPGVYSKTVLVTVNGDDKYETDETVLLQLSSPAGGVIVDAEGTCTIQNDDSQPSLSIDSPSADELDSGTNPLDFTVSLTNASYQQVTVDYATADGTAAAGTDYAAASSTLNIPPDALTGTISVQMSGDTAFEPDEDLTVTLSGATNAGISSAVGTGTITNDDTQPEISISDVSASEGGSGVTTFDFTVTLSNASYETVTVSYATSDATADAGDDYTAASGTLTFVPFDVEETVSVDVLGDDAFEPDEIFSVQLTSPANATFADPTGLGTVLNDDSPPPAGDGGGCAPGGGSPFAAAILAVAVLLAARRRRRAFR